MGLSKAKKWFLSDFKISGTKRLLRIWTANPENLKRFGPVVLILQALLFVQIWTFSTCHRSHAFQKMIDIVPQLLCWRWSAKTRPILSQFGFPVSQNIAVASHLNFAIHKTEAKVAWSAGTPHVFMHARRHLRALDVLSWWARNELAEDLDAPGSVFFVAISLVDVQKAAMKTHPQMRRRAARALTKVLAFVQWQSSLPWRIKEQVVVSTVVSILTPSRKTQMSSWRYQATKAMVTAQEKTLTTRTRPGLVTAWSIWSNFRCCWPTLRHAECAGEIWCWKRWRGKALHPPLHWADMCSLPAEDCQDSCQ